MTCGVQNGCGVWSDTGALESLISVKKAIFTFARQKNEIYEWSGEQLRVNTSLFAW